jgi:hypothetical protein
MIKKLEIVTTEIKLHQMANDIWGSSQLLNGSTAYNLFLIYKSIIKEEEVETLTEMISILGLEINDNKKEILLYKTI